MKKIGWIEIHRKRHGGVVYNEQAREELAKRGMDVELIDVSSKLFSWFRYLKIPEALIRLFCLRTKKDVWVRDFFSTLTLPFERRQGKNIVLIHHIDIKHLPGLSFITQPLLSLAEALFYKNLRKADALVVVSEYWREHFARRGYPNIHVIYNAFDTDQFDISQQEVDAFKSSHGLENKPIVYLGNCQKVKGVIEAYDALKDLDVHLITSGTREVVLPATNLDLSYRDYLTLLKASSVVLTMSHMQEGWNRTAHEAMLLKTPVIGSGTGGMGELLKGGRQIICKDFSSLRKEVERLLGDERRRQEMGNAGYDFAKNFTRQRLGDSWFQLISNI